MHERPTLGPGSKTARLWLAALTSVGVLTLAACAPSPAGTAAPSPTPPSSASTSTPTPSLPPSPSATVPAPTPTGSPTVDAPYNGDVLVVTADDVDGRLEVTAMVPGISEEAGTCRLELIDEGTSASVTGTAGNGVTYCGVMSLTPQTAAGELRFRVRYESASTRAESAISTVESTR